MLACLTRTPLQLFRRLNPTIERCQQLRADLKGPRCSASIHIGSVNRAIEEPNQVVKNTSLLRTKHLRLVERAYEVSDARTVANRNMARFCQTLQAAFDLDSESRKRKIRIVAGHEFEWICRPDARHRAPWNEPHVLCLCSNTLKFPELDLEAAWKFDRLEERPEPRDERDSNERQRNRVDSNRRPPQVSGCDHDRRYADSATECFHVLGQATNGRLQPPRLMIPSAAVGCKRWNGLLLPCGIIVPPVYGLLRAIARRSPDGAYDHRR